MDKDFFENEIAPAILQRLKQCTEAGIPFVATFQVGPSDEPGCLRTFAWLPADTSAVAQTIADMRAASGAPFPETQKETDNG